MTPEPLRLGPISRGRGRTRLAVAIGLSIALHGAALASFLLLDREDATTANPAIAIAVEIVETRPATPTQPPTTRLSTPEPEVAIESAPRPAPPVEPETWPTKAPQPDRAVPAPSVIETAPEPTITVDLIPPAETATAKPIAVARLPQPPPAPSRKPEQPVEKAAETQPQARVFEQAVQELKGPSGTASQRPSKPQTATLAALTAPVEPPRFAGAGLANPSPRYPYVARRRGQEGRVILRVAVSADGKATTVSIRRSSGYRLLDEAALETVKRWRFQPARRSSQAVPGLVDVPVAFRLTR